MVDPSDEEKFKRLYGLVHERSPGRHSFQALNDLAYMYKVGLGVQKDLDKAAELRRKKLLYATDAQSEYSVGQDFLLNQNYKLADKHMQRAADQGHAEAQYTIAMMAYKGEGMAAPDYPKALTFFELVCFVVGCYSN